MRSSMPSGIRRGGPQSPSTNSPAVNSAIRLSLLVARLSESQSDSKVRPQRCASISWLQTFSSASFSRASSHAPGFDASPLLWSGELEESSQENGDQVNQVKHRPIPSNKR